MLLGATPLILFAVNRVDDARAALSRFNSVVAATALLEQATDFDRDGYSLFSFPLDAQPFDGSRHPYALDIRATASTRTVWRRLALQSAPGPSAHHRRPPPERHLIVLESTRDDASGAGSTGGR